MDEKELLAERFQAHRPRLWSLARRILGSEAEDEDAVQEAWIKLSRSDHTEVANLAGWLTTVVARTCLNMLHPRRARREDPLEAREPEPMSPPAAGGDPEYEAQLADSIGSALTVVLETLAPVERLAFVLHDMFAVPFDQIAVIVNRSPAATRQLASRARRRVRGSASQSDVDQGDRRRVVGAFLAASREGDFEGLLSLLAPEVVLDADETAVQTGAVARRDGARAVAEIFCGRARAAIPAFIEGHPGAVWANSGAARVVFEFYVSTGRITRIELIADVGRLRDLDLEYPVTLLDH
jgi:RNA polymerase sigma factor (sigma-70 family)